MTLTSKEINVRKVKTLLRNLKAEKISPLDASTELNQRFDRMEREDTPWFEDLYPKYRSLIAQ